MKENKCNRCLSLSKRYEGKQITDIPELLIDLEEVSVDLKNWITVFKCQNCDQIWVEQFESRGHGEVPVVYKK